jgi:hypothetical protein
MRLRAGRLHKAIYSAVFALTLVSCPAAHASGFAAAEDCPTASLEQPFLPWMDSDLYSLVPNGDLEGDAAGWSLDGARVVAGNEPFYVHAAADSHSLSLPSAAAATSGMMCVGVEERTLRLFVRSSNPSSSSKLKVEVVFEDTQGTVRSQPVDAIPADEATSWTPHEPMVIGISSHPRIDGKTPVRFRFTAQGPADWQIDDVYVDPRYY